MQKNQIQKQLLFLHSNSYPIHAILSAITKNNNKNIKRQAFEL